MRYRLTVLLLLITLLFGGGCSEDSQPSMRNPLLDDVTISIETRDVFEQPVNLFTQGETIRFVLSLVNNSDRSLTFNFVNGQQYDFSIDNAAGDSVRQWSENLSFTQAESQFELAANETRLFIWDWDQTQTCATCPAVVPGDYTVIGWIVGFGGFHSTDFTIN